MALYASLRVTRGSAHIHVPFTTNVKPLRLRAAAALAALAFAGCQSPREGVDKREAVIAGRFAETAAAQKAGFPVVELTWTDARQRLHRDNLDLRSANNSIISAEERRRQVFKDLIPGANINANAVQALTELGNFSEGPASLNLVAFFNLPGAIQIRLRYYAATLEIIRARWAFELRERELTLQLRELFLRTDILAQRDANFRRSRQWANNGGLTAALDAPPESIQNENALWSLHREGDSLQTSLSQLLGDATAKWKPLAETAPVFDYGRNPPDPADLARFGVLYRQLQAINLEGAALGLRGIRLQNWPDLRVSVTSPPLYTADNNGTNSNWSTDQVLVSLNAGLTLDTTGRVRQQLREGRREFALLESRIKEQHALTVQQLVLARDELLRNRDRLALTELRLSALRDLPSAQSPARLRENLDRLLTLEDLRTSLILDRTQLEALFWLLDETRWTRPVWEQPAATVSKTNPSTNVTTAAPAPSSR